MIDEILADVWRLESAHVLGALLRRHGSLGDCEDAAQEALLAAARQWPEEGVPGNPRGWLIRVAERRLVDQVRTQTAQARREVADALARRLDDPGSADPTARPEVSASSESGGDDSLRLVLLCCHPALSHESQVALTLRCVAGLSTEAIAAAYLVPASTMAQRLSRARATLRQLGARFELPGPGDLPARVAAALDVCYLIFTEGHTRSSGTALVGSELAAEGIRLTRLLHALVPDHDEVAGALALMLVTHARTPARTKPSGDLVPMAEQDRALWDAAMIDEGVALLERTLPRGHVGRFQLQAAIAAVHVEATSYADTDWRQISMLYGRLHEIAPSPAVLLNWAVAVAMTDGPAHGIAMVTTLLGDPAMSRHHRTYAVLAHLSEQLGDLDAAREHFATAARLTSSLPEQRYLNRRLLRLREQPPVSPGS